MRKYQNKLMNCNRRIGVKTCHFILQMSASLLPFTLPRQHGARIGRVRNIPRCHPLVIHRVEHLSLHVPVAGQLTLATRWVGTGRDETRLTE